MDLKFYKIMYASGILNSSGYKQEKIIFSTQELEIEDFVVIESKGNGVFIGKVIEDVTDFIKENEEDIDDPYDVTQYRYIQKI